MGHWALYVSRVCELEILQEEAGRILHHKTVLNSTPDKHILCGHMKKKTGRRVRMVWSDGRLYTCLV